MGSIKGRFQRRILSALPTPLIRYLWQRGECGIRERDGIRLHLNRYEFRQGGILAGHPLPSAWKLIAESVRRGETVVDIGANIGIVSLLCAAKLEGTGRVFSFEPDPFVFQRLCRNVAINENLRDMIEPVRAAVSDKSGSSTFASVMWGNLGAGTLEINLDRRGRLERLRRKMRLIEVDIVKMDDWCETRGIGRLDVVKMDVEAHELKALNGMAGILARSPGVRIFVDCHPGLGVPTDRVFDLLRGWGMKVEGWDFEGDDRQVVVRSSARMANVGVLFAYKDVL